MSDDGLRYERMVERALRGVVSEALSSAADHGLPGNHHFYVTFRTDYPGVLLAAHLQERFPSEMTIVIQHQFWGLKVDADHFEVTLSFNDKPERLQIPLGAVTAFADPSVRFALQFDAGQESDVPPGSGEEEITANSPDAPPADGTGTALTPVDESASKLPAAQDDKGNEKDQDRRQRSGKSGTAKKEAKKEAGEVVSLDAFRKK